MFSSSSPAASHSPARSRCGMRASAAALLLATALLSTAALGADGDPGGRTLALEAWLHVEPVAVPLPVFHDEEAGKVEVKHLLDSSQLPWSDLWPAKGDELVWPGQSPRSWREVDAAGGVLSLGEVDEASPALALAAAYLEVDRFTKAKLRLKSPHLLRVFIDGEKKGEKDIADAPTDGLEATEGEESGHEGDADEAAEADFVGQTSVDLDLVQGTHLVLVQALRAPEGPSEWTLSAELELDEENASALVSARTANEHPLRLTDLLDVDVVRGISLSADGQLLAVSLRYPMPPADFSNSWFDIRETKEGQVVHSLRGVGTLSSFRWGPDPERHRYAFVETDDKKSTLWVGDADGGEMRAVLKDLEDFGGFTWVPGEESIVYSIDEEPDEKHEGIKRYQGLTDRWTGTRTKSHLYQVSVRDGATRRLTAGAETSTLEDIAADGRRLLFTRTLYLDAEWPFQRTQLYELDLATLERTLVREIEGGLGAQYSPDGKQVLITAGPTAFGGIGLNVPQDTVPNLYDTQAYILDLASGEVAAITRDFDPNIDQAAWSAKDGSILFRAGVGSTTRLFRYEPKKRSFEELPTPIDVVSGMTLSADGKVLAFYGTGLNTPQRIYASPVKSKPSAKLLWESDPDRYESVVPGEVEEFDFVKADGTTIQGRVYLPPGLDSGATYPAIVYYYGGTSPVDRSFGGRYPKEWWAAHGYVVYVLQPSGATGYGQEFSARHVNDWGKTTTGEIIEGTRKFLAAYPYVDPERVGCIGASYGGFMTMLLITETDLYSAAVSHAGISSLSSYWGEGWWGYIYSAAATAHSYPWNRPDIYVDQSALFQADKTSSPLLLLHGGDDPNVPPGESEQLYTALRILGKDVEYIRIAGEVHWIMNYPKRKIWHETIVAYFDWKLKEQPGWWDHLYGEDAE